MALQPGDRFGRYELVSWLGRGGMAETWRARLVGDAGVTKPVLIKKVLPEFAGDEAFISMFISEARISATLSHGNVAQVFDFGRVDGDYFLAMEFVDGQPLHRILKRAARSGLQGLPIPLATFVALEMCRGLHYAHTRADEKGVPLGIVHRDISPDNVLVSYEGQVKIVDFGIAKARSLRNFDTEPGVVKGKYLFFSPEQARGREVDARTDVWATGVVLFELLCGQMPVSGAQYSVMTRMANGEFPSPRQVRKDLPAELDEIVMRALSVGLDTRFESSHAFGDALAGFLYRFAPRFSSMNLAHLVRELYRSELAQEGRELAVPPAFLEELALWRRSVATPSPAAPDSGRVTSGPPMRRPGTGRSSSPGPETTAGRSPRVSLSTVGIGAGAVLALGAAALLLTPSAAPVPQDLSPILPLREPVAADAVRSAVDGSAPPAPTGQGAPAPGAATLERPTEAGLLEAGTAASATGTVDPAADAGAAGTVALSMSEAPDAGTGGEHASATYPVSSIWLDAKRDVFLVPRNPVAFPGLTPSRTYQFAEISDEPLPPEPDWVVEPSPSTPPRIYFLHSGKGLSAEAAMGEVTRGAVSVRGASSISFFSLGTPSQEAAPERVIQIFSSQIGSEKQFTFQPGAMRASEEKAFLLTGLDGTAVYSLMLKAVGDGAFTRGRARGPVRRVACVQWLPPAPPGASAPAGWPVSFFVSEGRRVDVTGIAGMRCGFIDDDVSDNLGKVEVQIRSIGTSKGDVASERRTRELALGATAAMKARDYKRALDLSRRCLDLNPVHADCLLVQGSTQARLGDLRTAASSYRSFVERYPDDPRADNVRKLLRDYDEELKHQPKTYNQQRWELRKYLKQMRSP